MRIARALPVLLAVLMALLAAIPTGASAGPTATASTPLTHAPRGAGVAGPHTRAPTSAPTLAEGWTDLGRSVGTPPPARSFASVTYDAADGYTLLFGGFNVSTGNPYADTWILKSGQWSELSPTVSPPARRGGAIAYDARDGYVVLFGGDQSGSMLSDTWKFSAGTWTDLTPTTLNSTNSPSARFVATMTYDAKDGYLLLFGGCVYVGCLSQDGDTWRFSGGAWQPVSTTTAPSPRGGAALVWDPALPGVLLYGGSTSSSSHSGETWAYLGGNWSKLSVAGPGNRSDALASYDVADRLVVLFGGLLDYASGGSNRPVADTWIFAGGAWANVTNRSLSAPGPRWTLEDESGTYDPGLGGVVLFGGRDDLGVDHNGTWVFATPLTLGLTASAPTVRQSEGVRFNTSLRGGSFAYQLSFSGFPSACQPRTPSFVCAFNVSGNYTLSATVVDSAGVAVNASVALSVTARFEVVPAVNRTSGTVPLAVTFSETLLNAASPLRYNWSFGDGTTNGTTAVVSHTYLATGSFAPQLEVTDALGGEVVASAPTVTAYTPLALALTANVSHGTVPLAVSFNATVFGGVSPIVYAWSFGDGSAGSTGAGETRVAHLYALAGSYTATVSATDSAGGFGTASIAVVVATPLRVTVSPSSPRGVAPLNVTLSASASGGLAPFSFSWTFGDSATGTGATTSHLYPSAGSYTSVVVVTDAVGQSVSASVTVDVAPAFSVALVATPASVARGGTLTLAATTTWNGSTYCSSCFAFAWSGLPLGCATANASTLRCSPSATGTYGVEVVVGDGFENVTALTTVTVTIPPLWSGLFSGGASSPFVLGLLVGIAVVVVALAVWRRRARRAPTPPAPSGVPGPSAPGAPAPASPARGERTGGAR